MNPHIKLTIDDKIVYESEKNDSSKMRIKQILSQQIELLAEYSKCVFSCDSLPGLTEAMIKLVLVRRFFC